MKEKNERNTGLVERMKRFKRFTVFGGDGGEATPVPIPNTEVKLSSADGTAGFTCGRVGRRRI